MAKVVYLTSLILSVIIAGCAGQFPPSGGPVDKTPPKLVSSSPLPRELNFNLRKIVLGFDKYMNEREVDNAIYFPPYGPKDMDFDWSGKKLTVNLHKPLEKDRTYIMTVAASAEDLIGNHLERAINLVFSTGSQVDTGMVSGRVYADKKQPYTVAAYQVSDSIDTLNPATSLPKYVTQSDDSGRYIMQGLAVGKYRLVSFDDQMRTFTYVPQIDQYASASRDIEITGAIQSIEDVNFMTVSEDTSLPQLYSAELATDGSLILTFSEAIDSASVLPSRFFVRDSTTGKEYPIDYAVRLEPNPYDVVLGMRTALPIKKTLMVTALGSITDLQKNRMSSENNTIAMKIDSATIEVTPYFNFTDSLRDVSTRDTLICQFISKVVYTDSAAVDVSLYDSTNAVVPGAVERESSTIFRVLPAGLNSLEWYSLKLRYTVGADGLPTSKGSGKDSVLVRHFRMIDFLSFGEIEGSVTPVSANQKIVVAAIRADGKNCFALADADGKFRLDKVPAGQYTIRAYVQHKSEINYFAGRSHPFQFAEPFGVYNDPVKVRARWTTEGVEIRLY